MELGGDRPSKVWLTCGSGNVGALAPPLRSEPAKLAEGLGVGDISLGNARARVTIPVGNLEERELPY